MARSMMSSEYPQWVAERVDWRPDVLAGEACFRDTRLPVCTIGRLTADDHSAAALCERYPQISLEDVLHAERYLTERLKVRAAMEKALANPQNRHVLRELAKR